MKILFLSYKFWPDVGGIEVNTEILCNFFIRFEAEVHLITTSKVVNTSRKNFPYKVIRDPAFRELIKEHLWADIVFENNPVLHLSWPLILSQRKHVVAIRTWINRNDGRISIRDRIKKRWVMSANKIIAVSKEIKSSINSEAIIIGNPYRADLFRCIPHIQPKSDFVFMGRLVSDKGADMAIELLAELNSRAFKGVHNKFKLTIIGDGEEKDRLQELAGHYGLGDLVSFRGVLTGDDLVEALNAHKYIVVPSKWKEPFGNIVLEGMACGCLPIVSDGGGLPEAVGSAGVVFTRNNFQSLYEKVEELLLNPKLEQKLRIHITPHLNKHAPEIIARKYFEVIKAITNDSAKENHSFSSHRKCERKRIG